MVPNLALSHKVTWILGHLYRYSGHYSWPQCPGPTVDINITIQDF